MTNRPNTIFTADVTLGTIQERHGAKGRYVVVHGSSLRTPRGRPVPARTIMAFGERCSLLEGQLRGNGAVQLKLIRDGGSYVVISAQPKTTPKPAAAPREDTLLQACIDAAGFDEHASYGA